MRNVDVYRSIVCRPFEKQLENAALTDSQFAVLQASKGYNFPRVKSLKTGMLRNLIDPFLLELIRPELYCFKAANFIGDISCQLERGKENFGKANLHFTFRNEHGGLQTIEHHHLNVPNSTTDSLLLTLTDMVIMPFNDLQGDDNRHYDVYGRRGLTSDVLDDCIARSLAKQFGVPYKPMQPGILKPEYR